MNSIRVLVHFLNPFFRLAAIYMNERDKDGKLKNVVCIFNVNGLSSAHNVNYNVVQPTTNTHGRGHRMRM